MKFGKLSKEELDSARFSLPPDSEHTRNILSSSKNTLEPSIYVGCGKWGRKEWVGGIYPEKTKEADFLSHYVTHFNSIELNATHYKLYGHSTIAQWAEKARGKDFKFCPKVAKSISHYGSLVSEQVKERTAKFIEGISAFGEYLGPVFLQLNDQFAPAKSNDLFKYLETLPKEIEFFVEVRHPDWFSDEGLRRDYFDTLQQLHIGAVITDTASRRDCVHMELTIPKAFIRFEGNNLHTTDYSRVDEWVIRLRDWLANGLTELYFFMHQPDEQFTPELALYAQERLRR